MSSSLKDSAVIQLLKKLRDRLDPDNDWVLSRFGGYEGHQAPASPHADERENSPPVSAVLPGRTHGTARELDAAEVKASPSASPPVSDAEVAVTRAAAERKSRAC